MIHAIATTSKRVDTTVLMLLSKMQDHYNGNNYTKVMVNVTPFAVDATSADQIKLTKNGTLENRRRPRSAMVSCQDSKDTRTFVNKMQTGIASND